MPRPLPSARLLVALAAFAAAAGGRAAEAPPLAPACSLRHEDPGHDPLFAFAPDGATVVGCGKWGEVVSFDAATGEPRRRFKPEGYAHGLAISPDGTLLALATNRGDVEIWDLPAAKLRNRLEVWEWNLYAAAFSPDGRSLASSGRYGQVIVWDLGSGLQTRTLGEEGGRGERVERLVYSPDGAFLAAHRTGGLGRDRIDVWDLETGRVRGEIPTGHSYRPFVGFSADGKRAACGRIGGVNILDLRDSRVSSVRLPDEIVPARHLSDVSTAGGPVQTPGVTLSPDWSLAASGLKDGRIAVWDLKSRTVRRYLTGGNGPYGAAGGEAAFSPDGRRLAAGNRGEPVRVWDLGDGGR